MSADDQMQAVSDYLFSEEGMNVFAVLDGASAPGLRMRLYDLGPEHFCLFTGELEDDMAEVAPYLVRLEPETEFTEWVISKGWGRHWGVFAVTTADIREMRPHLRALLNVYTSDGNPLLFRYYDPRVLRLFLPTCAAQELTAFFGPVASFVAEGEDPKTILRFRVAAGALREEKKTIPDRKE